MKNYIIAELGDYTIRNKDIRSILNFVQQLKEAGKDELAIQVDACMDGLDFKFDWDAKSEKMCVFNFLSLTLSSDDMGILHRDRKLFGYEYDMTCNVVKYIYSTKTCSYQSNPVLANLTLKIWN